ncbi:rhodanese-like domain-containing protein [Niabella ginsengisoli]|uniref:Rhodanese-like domain-containing protein n=1 Tax=Niabella ginsengisoli TaxID=522298 RepID=A0ABS9SPF4_9BACT|nr:rhodanese-like domain-containing protein [Niabella ginsengisoli]MCH5600293.1 rhodanese-like domain-containing protein [Niabella ginsengisoli]
MKNITSIIYILFSFLLIGCADAQQQNNTLEATAFSEKIKATPDAVVLDVRTPQEFAKGHLPSAINYDWNDKNFQSQVAALDKSKPLFVYCLSGGRSSKAAETLRSKGFKHVYELNGGIMKWRSAQLPEEKIIHQMLMN